MLYFTLSYILIAMSITNQVSSIEEDYYWREYTGTVPLDAITVGKDINGRDTYVGQAYIKDEGLFVVQIYPGVKEVFAAIKGVKKVDKYIKILCGQQSNFQWLPSNSTNLHLDLIDKHAVIGGHEDGLGYMNIGRISYDGEIRIAKINSFHVGYALLHLPDKDEERKIASYEVLFFSPIEVDLRVKM